ncbi:MAG: hypothetical protein PHN40_03005 [Dysgonamonadaceae bacterium]|nr:hypothetical protein [Dysgonamonadaceae bacterium]
MMMRPARSVGFKSMRSHFTTTSLTPHSAMGPDNMPKIAAVTDTITIATSINPLVDVKK